jgi:hypothetical protein
MCKDRDHRRTPMAQSSTGLVSYMAESVSVKRWWLYSLRFLYFFFMFLLLATNAMAMVFNPPARALATALVLTLAMSALLYLSERYRGRYPRAEIVVLLVLLVIALAIVWRGIERHRHNVLMNSSPTISHP